MSGLAPVDLSPFRLKSKRNMTSFNRRLFYMKESSFHSFRIYILFIKLDRTTTIISCSTNTEPGMKEVRICMKNNTSTMYSLRIEDECYADVSSKFSLATWRQFTYITSQNGTRAHCGFHTKKCPLSRRPYHFCDITECSYTVLNRLMLSKKGSARLSIYQSMLAIVLEIILCVSPHNGYKHLTN